MTNLREVRTVETETEIKNEKEIAQVIQINGKVKTPKKGIAKITKGGIIKMRNHLIDDPRMPRSLCFIVLFITMVSCNEALVKSEFHATDNGSWAKDDVIEFTFSKMDTIQEYGMFINVRNDNSFFIQQPFLNCRT